MDHSIDLATDMPTRYRHLLDLARALEADEDPVAAARLRSQAVAVYSRGWDDASLRRLAKVEQNTLAHLARRRTPATGRVAAAAASPRPSVTLPSISFLVHGGHPIPH